MKYSSDIAFTDTVKEIQIRKGSRDAYERMSATGSAGFYTSITPDLERFLSTQNSVFLATVNSHGQPYIQHRGGPNGFIKVKDKQTLIFADYKGNRQFITQGNLLDNSKAFLFLIDYIEQSRIKIWGTARVIENDPSLLKHLMPSREEYRASPEQVIEFTLSVWDRNCPQHIPNRMELSDVESAIREKDEEIAYLKDKLKRYRHS